MEILQPCNAVETREVVAYSVQRARENTVIRLVIGPSPRLITLPDNHTLTFGRGVALTQGQDAILFGYGPVMLHEALTASELLARQGYGLQVVNMPWLNRVDAVWLAAILKPFRDVFVLEDHAPVGGLGDFLLDTLERNGQLEGRRVTKFAVEGDPA